MKSLDKVLEQCLKEKQQLKKDIKLQFEKIDAAIEYFLGIEDLFVK